MEKIQLGVLIVLGSLSIIFIFVFVYTVHLGYLGSNTRYGLRHRKYSEEEAERIETERHLANKRRIWAMFGLEYHGEGEENASRVEPTNRYCDTTALPFLEPPPPPYFPPGRPPQPVEIGEKNSPWGLRSLDHSEHATSIVHPRPHRHFELRVHELATAGTLRHSETTRTARRFSDPPLTSGEQTNAVAERHYAEPPRSSLEAGPPLYPRRLDSISRRRSE